MQTKQSKKLKLKSQDRTSKSVLKRKRWSLTFGTITAVCIILSPLLFFVYTGVPSVVTWDSPFGVITSTYYGDVQVFIWTFFNKIFVFVILLIWFFTCRHWWYHAIIVPICMIIFQLYTILSDEVAFIDLSEYYIIAPIIFLMLIFSYTVRTRIFDKIHGIDLSELSRVNWKGELKKENTTEKDDDNDDDDDDELFMSY